MERITPEIALRHPFCMQDGSSNTPTFAVRRSARLAKPNMTPSKTPDSTTYDVTDPLQSPNIKMSNLRL
jgi:hypothetical protein